MNTLLFPSRTSIALLLALLVASLWMTGCGADRADIQSSSQAAGGDRFEPVDPSQPGKIVISWGTESEDACYGFHVFRSRSPEGPFDRVTKNIIPGAGSTNLPQRYSFTDQPLQMGDIYYYYIEEVDLMGNKHIISPTTRGVVSKPADPAVSDTPPEPAS